MAPIRPSRRRSSVATRNQRWIDFLRSTAEFWHRTGTRPGRGGGNRAVNASTRTTPSRRLFTLGMVFHLSSRQSEGLLRSLFALMKLDNDVPDHTTISRRKAKLGKVPFY